MPGIEPAALSRPLNSTMSILPTKSLHSQAQNVSKSSKSAGVHPPPRIDLEPLYMALKCAISEHWGTYKEAIVKFLSGNLNQAEFSARINPFIVTPSGETEHLHNQLISGIYGNATRELPDHGVAPWVSANDKPTTSGAKSASSDATEQRLKTEVMRLPNRDRRRIKDLRQNDHHSQNIFTDMFSEIRRPKASNTVEPGGNLQMTNSDCETRKRYAQPLACESGEFPDTSSIESRMLPICFETGIVSGHASDAAQFMTVATETFIKEVLSLIFSKTRSNGPGSSGVHWIQTHKYRVQLAKEEEASSRGEILRDKSGLLPIEARAAIERGPLGMADVRTALELGDCGLGQMPSVVQQIMLGYREGEVGLWDDYSWPESHVRIVGQDAPPADMDVEMSGMRSFSSHVYEAETENWGWEGCGPEDKAKLDNLLDSCLAI